MIDRAALPPLALYQEFYRPLGVESQVAFTLPARPPLLLGLALSRGAEDYSDAELELLALARPHLIQAYRKAELSSARAAALRALEDGLEALAGTSWWSTRTAGWSSPPPARRADCSGDAAAGAVRDWLAGARRSQPMADPLALTLGGVVRARAPAPRRPRRPPRRPAARAGHRRAVRRRAARPRS